LHLTYGFGKIIKVKVVIQENLRLQRKVYKPRYINVARLPSKRQVCQEKENKMSRYSISVLVNNKPTDVYNHPSTSDKYIEGRQGSAYKLKLTNDSWAAAEFCVSIDGLSINNGKQASKESPGYIVPAKSSVVIDGWLVDSDTAAKFVFGAKEKSYTNQVGNGTDNTGVIGLRVYSKKVEYVPPIYNDIWTTYPKLRDPWFYQPNHYWGGSSISAVGMNNVQLSNSTRSVNTGPDISSFTNPEEVSSLGTEFGEDTTMKTTQVSFERASEVPVFEYVLYYDDVKGLNLRGIQTFWQSAKVPKTKPNPFPGDFCAQPPGWTK
jgi:hypothetical protein